MRGRETKEASPGLLATLASYPPLMPATGWDQHRQPQGCLAKYTENINSVLITVQEKCMFRAAVGKLPAKARM